MNHYWCTEHNRQDDGCSKLVETGAYIAELEAKLDDFANADGAETFAHMKDIENGLTEKLKTAEKAGMGCGLAVAHGWVCPVIRDLTAIKGEPNEY